MLYLWNEVEIDEANNDFQWQVFPCPSTVPFKADLDKKLCDSESMPSLLTNLACFGAVGHIMKINSWKLFQAFCALWGQGVCTKPWHVLLLCYLGSGCLHQALALAFVIAALLLGQGIGTKPWQCLSRLCAPWVVAPSSHDPSR